MTAFVQYNCFMQDLGRGVHNLHTATLKVAFTNRAPDVTLDAAFADIGEIAAGNGYVAGGFTLVGTSWTQVGGIVKMPGTDISIVSSTGPLGPFRFLVLYNATLVTKNLIGYWDRGGSITLDGTISEPFVQHFADATQVLSLQLEEPESLG